MRDDTPPNVRIEYTREAREYYYYPVRRSTRIEDGDWSRWIRCISNVPKRKPMYREIAFASFGISLPSLVSTFVTMPRVAQLPGWVSTTYLVTGLVTLAIGVVCLVFDRQMEEISSNTVESILLDMKEVHERSVRAEEMTSSGEAAA